jgi:hypothetical protein
VRSARDRRHAVRSSDARPRATAHLEVLRGDVAHAEHDALRHDGRDVLPVHRAVVAVPALVLHEGKDEGDNNKISIGAQKLSMRAQYVVYGSYSVVRDTFKLG